MQIFRFHGVVRRKVRPRRIDSKSLPAADSSVPKAPFSAISNIQCLSFCPLYVGNWGNYKLSDAIAGVNNKREMAKIDQDNVNLTTIV